MIWWKRHQMFIESVCLILLHYFVHNIVLLFQENVVNWIITVSTYKHRNARTKRSRKIYIKLITMVNWGGTWGGRWDDQKD